jgi:hypothetical protein
LNDLVHLQVQLTIGKTLIFQVKCNLTSNRISHQVAGHVKGEDEAAPPPMLKGQLQSLD